MGFKSSVTRLNQLVVKSTYMIVIADVDGKLGRGQKGEERYTSRYGIGKRDDSGDGMATVAAINKLFVASTGFWKKPGSYGHLGVQKVRMRSIMC